MNTPQNVATANKTILPEPGYPMVTRVISDSIFPADPPGSKDEPIVWMIGVQHPFIPEMNVMRMFVDDVGAEIYSVSADGRSGMRNMLPMSHIRYVEEAMPLEEFVEELTAAENGDDDEPDDPQDDPDPDAPEEPEAPEPPAPSNGQQTAPS